MILIFLYMIESSSHDLLDLVLLKGLFNLFHILLKMALALFLFF